MAHSNKTVDGRYQMNMSGWPTERWTVVVVLGALGVLIAIRMGFRGVNVFGVGVNVS